jgi:hypothetical protein
MTSDKTKWEKSGLADGEVLDREGLWYLVRVPEYAKWQSWVVHGCKKDPPHTGGEFHHRMGFFVRVDQDDPTCMGCGLVCPDKFKTIWTLHNWDALQAYLQKNPR